MNNNSLENKRCLGLSRCSTDPQAVDSLEQQLVVLKKGCADRKMIWVGHEEETVSGTEPGNRSDLERILERKKTKNDFDVVLVTERARWTRAGQAHGSWLKVEFARAGLRIISTKSKSDGTGRYAWIEDGIEDEGNFDFSFKLSYNSCRGMRAKIESGMLAYTKRPPFGIDRLYTNPEGKPLHILRNLRDRSQQRLHPETLEVIDTYPPEERGQAKRHYRKQKSERIILIPGEEEALNIIRFIYHQYYVVGLGCFKIAGMLNEKGWQSPTGMLWDKQVVSNLVNKPIYAGRGISQMFAAGKFHNHAEGTPRQLEYDLADMMARRRVTQKRRPSDEWKIIEYPQLLTILGPEMAETVWQKQKLYLTKKADKLSADPNRDPKRTSRFFLKHVLQCKESEKYFHGRNSGRGEHGYYVVTHHQSAPNPNEPWKLRGLPAKVVQDKAKAVLKEVLESAGDLKPLIRSVVEQEVSAFEGQQHDLAALDAEAKKIDHQIAFALTQLGDLGADTVKTIITPLKEKRHALTVRKSDVEAMQRRVKPDVDKTVESIATELKDIGTNLDGLSAPVLRNLFLSFSQMKVDLKEFSIDFDVRLPAWTVHRAGEIGKVVGSVVNQGQTWLT